MKKAEELIKRHEGLRLKPYRDSVGKLTIGYGRNLDDVGLRKDEAEYLFQNDYRGAVLTARLFCKDSWHVMSDDQQDAIVDMAFNLGQRLFQFKKMREAILDEDFERASAEMLNSKWARQLPGRAKELASLMRGEYESTD